LQANFPDFKTWLLLGDRVTSGDQTVFHHASKPDRFFKQSGISVIRDVVSGREVVFVGNGTPLGMPPLFAHGHLDAGSFWLSIAGQEFFVDPGTYLYQGGNQWRRYFRSTAAHNTVRVNRWDFTEQVADFMYGRPYRITTHELTSTAKRSTWRMAHDAYERLEPKVTFRRQVVMQKACGYFEFHDTLESVGNYFAELFFHLHPACQVRLNGHALSIQRDAVCLGMQIDTRLKINIYNGSETPLLGWFSKEFNHIEKTTTILCSGHFEGLTVLRNDIRTL
jgi:uncharacterized heparinase superfamily protein